MSHDTTTNTLVGTAGTTVSLFLANVNVVVSILAGLATATYMALCAYHKYQDCKERRAKACKNPLNQP